MQTNNENKMSQKNNVICYMRSSTDKQEIESQRKELYNAIHADGYTDEQVIEVGKAGISACTLKDEYFQLFDEMESIIENGNVDCVYVYSMTRLVRLDDTRFVSFCKFLTDRKVNLKLKDSGMTLLNADGSYNFGMEVAIKITALVCKQQTKELKMQLERGKKRNREQGKWNGGRVLFGYTTSESGSFIVDEEEKKIVRRVYDTFLCGTSARQIAKQLYAEGIIKHTAEKSREVFVYKILKSPSYKGVVNEYGQTIYDRLVTDEEFDAAQAKLKDSQKAPRRVYADVVSYGLGLLRVANDQAKNGYYMMQPHRADNQYWEYNSKFCINADLTDSLLLQVVNTYIAEFSGMDAETRVEELTAQIDKLNTMAATSAQRASKAKEAIARIEKRFISGKISEQMADIQRKPYDDEAKRETEAGQSYAQQAGAIMQQIFKLKNSTLYNLYDMTDEQRAEEIKKYVDHVDVERVKNGTYKYTVYFKLTDRTETFVIRSKAHDYQRENNGEMEQYDIKMLNRYTDRRKADRERKKTEGKTERKRKAA